MVTRAFAERVHAVLIHSLVAYASFLKGRVFLAMEHALLVASALLLDLECQGFHFRSLFPRPGASHGILLGVTLVPALASALDPGAQAHPLALTTSPDHMRKIFVAALGLLALLALLGPKDRQGILRPRSSFAFMLAVGGILLCRSENELVAPILQRVLGLSPIISALTSHIMKLGSQDPAVWFAEHLGWVVLGPILTLAFLAGARRTLTVGEAAAFGHAASVLCWVAIPRLQERRTEADTWGATSPPLQDPRYALDLLLLAGLAGLGAWVVAMALRAGFSPGPTHRTLQRLLWITVSALVLATVREDARAVLLFALEDPDRTWLMALWASLMAVALALMGLLSSLIGRRHRVGAQPGIDPSAPSARSYRAAKVILRKGFHLLGVLVMLPGLALAPTFLGTALAIAAFALAALEATRLLGFRVVAGPIERYMRPFTDTRDSGQVLTTHFSLLLGLAVPLWVSAALGVDAAPPLASSVSLYARPSHWLTRAIGKVKALLGAGPVASAASGISSTLRNRQAIPPELGAFSGIITLGVMDVAASLVGSLVGGPRLVSDSDKTVSGTAAGILSGCIASVFLSAWRVGLLPELYRLMACREHLGLAWEVVRARRGLWLEGVLPGLVACAGSGLVEALTDQIDNMVLPYYHWMLLLAAQTIVADLWGQWGRA